MSHPAGPDPVPYLDQVAASTLGRSYKQQLLAALALRPGHAVADIGCGPGTDLPALAAAVAPGGTVTGIDHDPAMTREARRRTAGLAAVKVPGGDAHALPLATASTDRASADRVLMHLADPPRALAEMHPILRPGGLLTLAEPDWDTLAIDHPDLATSRAFTRFIAEHANRNQAIGRQLPRLAASAGCTIREVRADAGTFTDYTTAATILGLPRNTERAVAAGYLTPEAAHQWLTHLATQPFTAACTMFAVLAQA